MKQVGNAVPPLLAKAVAEVREDRAQVLMKGLLNTDNLLRAVLNKETGILPKGNVLTHITVADIPELGHLLLFTDAAVIPNPTCEQRIEQVKYITKIAHALHIEEPKISLIHCSEKVDERHFPCTADYVQIKELATKGEFGKCIVDGPLDLKTSLCYESMHHKQQACFRAPRFLLSSPLVATASNQNSIA